MAVKAVKPGRTSLSVTMRARFDTDLPLVFEAPGGLVPLRIAIFEIDQYRMRNGWPAPIPPMDIQAKTLCSGDGEHLADRPDPYQVVTNALMRWIVDPDYVDYTDLAWRAIQRGTDLEWRSSVEYMPSYIADYTYRFNSEVFTLPALNFDSDTRNHMWMDMHNIMNPTGYTVIMVMSPNSAYGRDVDVPYNGIWCYGEATPPGDTFSEPSSSFMNVTTMGNFVYLETDQTEVSRGPGIHDQLNSNSPMYLVMSFNRPNAALYAGSGPSSMHKVIVPTGTTVNPLSPSVVLGRSTGDVLHTADMAVFEIDMYADVLTDQQVITEISKLSRAYGGDT